MKPVLLILLFLTAFIGFGQEAVFRSGSLKLEYSPTPQIYYFNKSAVNKAGSPGWLLIWVYYSTPGTKTQEKTFWLDDISMETELVIPASYQGKNVVALLKGTTVFWSIPMDGKKHQALVLVPPQVIARFARKGNKIDTSRMMARVTFYTKGRKILARIHSSSSSRVRDYFNKVGGAVSSGVLTVDDIVMPRNQTPWAPLNFELFELIKPYSQK